MNCRSLLQLCLLFLIAVSAEAGTFRRVPNRVPNEYLVVLQPSVFDVRGTARQLAGTNGVVGGVWTEALRGFWIVTTEQHALTISRDPRVKSVEENQLAGLSGSVVTNNSAAAAPTSIDSASLPAALAPHYRYHLGRISHRQRQPDSSDTSNIDYIYRHSDRVGDVTVYMFDMPMNMFHKEFWSEADASQPPLYIPGDPLGSGILPHDPTVPAGRNAQGVQTIVEDIAESNPRTASRTVCGVTQGAQDVTAINRFYSGMSFTVKVNHAATGCMQYIAAPEHETELFGAAGLAHGTAVASMIAGRSVGVAPGVRLIPVMITNCVGQGDAKGLVNAAEWVLSHHKLQDGQSPAVANISIFWWRSCAGRSYCTSASSACPSSADVSCLEDVVRKLELEGISVVTSANNFGELGENVACQGTPSGLSRSAGGTVITVGGTAKASDRPWGHAAGPGTPTDCNVPSRPQSNRGGCIDIWAPAENLPLPCRASYGRYLDNTGNCTLPNSGTSFSAPMVSGILARLLGEDHRLWVGPFTAELAWQRLRDTATRFNVNTATVRSDQTDLLAYVGGVTFARQPQSVTIRANDNPTLEPEAVQWPGEELCYQWYVGETGETAVKFKTHVASPALVVTPVDVPAGTSKRFWVRAQKRACSAIPSGEGAVPNAAYGDSQSAVVTRDDSFACAADIPNFTIETNPETRTFKKREGFPGFLYGRLRATAPVTADVRNLSFEWYEQEAGLAGEGMRTELVRNGTQYETALYRYLPVTRTYYLRVTRYCGGVATKTAVFGPQTVVVTGPQSSWPRVRAIRFGSQGARKLTFNTGMPYTLTVPEESADYVYEWYRNAVLVGTQSTLPERFDYETRAVYHVITRNVTTGASSVSLDLTVTVTIPQKNGFEITVDPPGRMVLPGGTATLTVRRGAETAFSWYEGTVYGEGKSLPGNTTLVLNDLQVDTTVWVENGTLASEFITIRVGCPQGVGGSISVPNGGRVSKGEMAVLTPIVVGDLISYEWFRGTTGDTTNRISIWPVLHAAPVEPVEQYWLRLTDGCDRVRDLDTVNLYLCVPTITEAPRSRVTRPNEEETLRVAASPAHPTQTLSVKWFRDSDTFMQNPVGFDWEYKRRVPSGTEGYFAAIYSKCVTTDDNVIKTDVATIEACANPVIQSASSSGWLTDAGQIASLWVNATGKELTYQWYIGDSGVETQPISGANGAGIDVAPSVTTKYWCKITSQGLCVTNHTCPK